MSGVRTEVDASDLLRLADKVDAVPDAFKTSMRPELRTVGDAVKAAAASNASWSSRIPASLSVQVRLSGKGVGVSVKASHTKAPHARPFEGLLRDPFRHPVFGYGRAWVSQPARPFLVPAVQSKRSDIESGVTDAVAAAFAKAGIR